MATFPAAKSPRPTIFRVWVKADLGEMLLDFGKPRLKLVNVHPIEAIVMRKITVHKVIVRSFKFSSKIWLTPRPS